MTIYHAFDERQLERQLAVVSFKEIADALWLFKEEIAKRARKESDPDTSILNDRGVQLQHCADQIEGVAAILEGEQQ